MAKHGFSTELASALVRSRSPQRVSKGVQRAQRSQISSKISKLRHEGKPQEQAVATALSMARAGRLGPRGGYRRVGRR